MSLAAEPAYRHSHSQAEYITVSEQIIRFDVGPRCFQGFYVQAKPSLVWRHDLSDMTGSRSSPFAPGSEKGKGAEVRRHG